MADGVMKRMSLIFKSKANKALDKYEDPRETLDYAYQKQLENMTQLRRSLADVATARKRIELQIKQVQQDADKRELQARRALEMGREDLARDALTRRSEVQQQISTLTPQHENLVKQEENLTRAVKNAQAKVDAFRTQKETIKANYTAAQAQTRIAETLTGISEEMGDVGMAIQRAQDKTAQLQARADAMTELTATGALDDPLAALTTGDDIDAELNRLSSGTGVDSELERMKLELAGGSTKQLEAGASGVAKPGAIQDAEEVKEGDSK
ncbi:PspA/IM30 family protein [Actinocrinis sp.]|jgi:phage shock protein A|uniref:PspA/IM30 family protein n=1 Tax=Actinocrinis sp. TaxID=1920516 RepID=UPI002BC25C0E|nr:PspA/IM30 family protein [Actinocrinis sp.]HXR69229.1 PspA/IM30 family protein [Actinocrinis sp.]